MATDNIARAIAAKALQIAQVSGGEGRGLSKVEIDKDGFLILTFTDETVSNVVKVEKKKKKIGQVYVPHINEENKLSWTIEDKAGEIPPEVDLTDNGEWEPVDGSGETDYKWEPI